MIVHFSCKETEKIWNGETSTKFPPEIQVRARLKLRMLHAAAAVMDLRMPPGNNLEALKGDRDGWYSIRINNQWRICFEWRDGNAHRVELTDYH